MSLAVADAVPVDIRVDTATGVSGLWLAPPGAQACFVVAHGAGAGMTHPFMVELASKLAAVAIATLRYQFPYMERHGRRPDPPAVCHATVRAAVATALELAPALPLIAGGKSFGGRMASQAQASCPLPKVHGLAFLGFPLHPPKEPSAARGEHLLKVDIPMLFIQGANDAFAEPQFLNPLIQRLGKRATRCELPAADHSFHVRAKSPIDQRTTNEHWLRTLAEWTETICRLRAEKG